jgi:hypothetical protein
MKITNAIINITSDNPERVTAFYRYRHFEPSPSRARAPSRSYPA